MTMLNQIQKSISKILDLRKGLILLGLVSIIVSGFVIGVIVVNSQDLTSKDTTPIFESGQYVQANNCELYYEVKSIRDNPFGKEVGFCIKQDKNNIPVFFYGCKVSSSDGTLNDNLIPTGNILVECARRVGSDSSTKNIKDCVKLINESGVKITGLGTGDIEQCKKYFSEFCASSWDNTNLFSQTLVNGEGSSSYNLCTKYLGFTEKPQIAIQTESAADVTKCVLPTDTELKEFEKNTDFAKDKAAKLFCKEAQGTGIYRCDKIDYAGDSSGTKCVAINKAAKESALKTTNQTGQGGNLATDAVGGIFTLIYQIVAAIIMALLFLVRYLQMTVLLLFISVMTVLLNLSPNTGFLTTLAVPLWSIFAQIASLGAVGLLIFYGSATMIGISGFEYQKTIEKGAKVAIYVFVSNFTYFGLAFAISLLDGFTKLIVFVFGGGSVFKLFEALIASVSSISKVGPGTSLIPDIDNIGKSVGAIFGMATNGGGAGNITTTLVKEIIVVVGLGLIIWVFGRIFFMLLTRVAILLLLLITSPIWVLGILVKDSLPSELQAQVTKAVNLVSGTVIFNFAFITTLVLVTIITQKINGGISDFQKSVADVFVPATNTGLAFIDGVSANAQSGVLSNDAFLGFGSGGFGETISICAVLGINLAIIYFAFDAIANLIDTNIVNVGKAVGGAVSKNLQNFRKADSFGQGLAMMGQDAFKYGSMAATGGNGLIGDAAGAGLKGVSMAERGGRKLYKTAATEDGRKQFGKDFTRTTGGLLKTGKDLGKVFKGDLSGLNVVGNLEKNLSNTSKGNTARERADSLDKEIQPQLENIQKLENQKSQTDDELQVELNKVEDDLTGQAKKDFANLREERDQNRQRMQSMNANVKATRLELAKKLASEGVDINDTSNIGNEDYDKYHQIERDRINAERTMQANDTSLSSRILTTAGTRAGKITSLETKSNGLKDDIKTKKEELNPKIRQRDYARKEEGHEKLDILKQQAKKLKDKSDYNAGGFSGILNNAEVISKRLDTIARTDNPQEIENLRKAVSQLQKDGKLTEDQASQIEGNLTKGKSDQEKAVAQILEAIKASKTT